MARMHVLGSLFPAERVREALLAREAWRPFPKASERAAWGVLPEKARAKLVSQGERLFGMVWPELPATLFLEFRRNGNRSRYEERHFARRQALVRLVLAECAEGAGRFLDDIVNGIWVLCEESFWGVPAHTYSDREILRSAHVTGGIGLPDTAFPVVDLFAAETGALLAWVLYLVGDVIAQELPVVIDRVAREEQRRILEPYRALDTWRWLGKNGRRPNNWNPWIHSNVLTVNLLLEEDEEVRKATVVRILEGLDYFLAGYHDDGGCDEGPSYWGRAGGSLYDCLEMLRSASGGELEAFGDPLVQEVGRYPYRVHIAQNWYVNFADAPAKVDLDGGILYRYGVRIGDELLQRHGAYVWQRAQGEGQATDRGSLGRTLCNLFTPPPPEPVILPPLVGSSWQEGIQVLTARQGAGVERGLYLAVKGGHNGESHNHNDVGNFVIAVDGEPVIIDVGVETYTRFTFGPERYHIWTMRSSYHNLPVVDGFEQAPGAEFRARDVRAVVEADRVALELDIAGAYPEAAGIAAWRRRVALEREDGGSVELRETFVLRHRPASLALHVMVRQAVTEVAPGVLRCASPSRPLEVTFDAEELSARCERLAITDARLASVWGDAVFRVVLESRRPRREGTWRLLFRIGD